MTVNKGLGIRSAMNSQMLSPPLKSIARSSPNLNDFFDEEMSLSEPTSFPSSLHSDKKNRSHLTESMRSYESDSNLSRGMSIPSPPLSPKVKHHDVAGTVAPGSNIFNFQEISSVLLRPIQNEWRVSKSAAVNRHLVTDGIVVRPVWDSQMTVQRYHSEMTDFLSGYSVFHGLHSGVGKRLSMSSGSNANANATPATSSSMRVSKRQLRGSDGDLDYELSGECTSSGSNGSGSGGGGGGNGNVFLPRIRKYNNVRRVSFSSPYGNFKLPEHAADASFSSAVATSHLRHGSPSSLHSAANSPPTLLVPQRQPQQNFSGVAQAPQLPLQPPPLQRQVQRRRRATVKRVKRVRTIPGGDGTSSTRPHHPAPVLASAAAIQNVPRYIPGVSWQRLPDYTPPMSNIPLDNTRALKVEWKGLPMDLTNDPLRHLLHPAELVLAQILRLPCDLYLDSKRRLFLEKVYKYKRGLPFRRTDAQKACRIDVNKASRLYAAYEKVGWLDDSNFEKYLE